MTRLCVTIFKAENLTNGKNFCLKRFKILAKYRIKAERLRLIFFYNFATKCIFLPNQVTRLAITVATIDFKERLSLSINFNGYDVDSH